MIDMNAARDRLLMKNRPSHKKVAISFLVVWAVLVAQVALQHKAMWRTQPLTEFMSFLVMMLLGFALSRVAGVLRKVWSAGATLS